MRIGFKFISIYSPLAISVVRTRRIARAKPSSPKKTSAWSGPVLVKPKSRAVSAPTSMYTTCPCRACGSPGWTYHGVSGLNCLAAAGAVHFAGRAGGAVRTTAAGATGTAAAPTTAGIGGCTATTSVATLKSLDTTGTPAFGTPSHTPITNAAIARATAGHHFSANAFRCRRRISFNRLDFTLGAADAPRVSADSTRKAFRRFSFPLLMPGTSLRSAFPPEWPEPDATWNAPCPLPPPTSQPPPHSSSLPFRTAPPPRDNAPED